MTIGDEERVLGQTVALLASRGDQESVRLLVEVTQLEFESTDDWFTDNTNWSDRYWAVVLYVDEQIIASFTDAIMERVRPTLIDVATRNGHGAVDRALIRPVLPEVSMDWRDIHRARTALRPTNQARRERRESAALSRDDLAFASREELTVYEALKHIQRTTPEDKTISIAPLPGVRLRAGHTWTPDLVVLGNGRALVFEVDGPHHRERRRYADDRNRDLQWHRCGIPVVRLPVEDTADPDLLLTRLTEELKRHLWPR